MKKILLACDLDNTLIRSYKKKKDGDICIEWIHDKEQGYINGEAYDRLKQLNNEVLLVPVTTRSVEQYKRIKWPEGAEPRYAVTTNGAILLDNGEPDPDWYAKSLTAADKYRAEMPALLEELQAEGDYIRCRMVDDMYLFSYCREGVNVGEKVEKYAARTELHVVASGKKIYFLPPEFNKGDALRRLREVFEPSGLMAAGDSDIDIPMLEAADTAFCKGSLTEKVHNDRKYLFNDENELITRVTEKTGHKMPD